MMQMSASEASALRELCATGTAAPGKCTALKARPAAINGSSTNSGMACMEAAELPSTEPASGHGGATPGANRTASEAATTYCTATKSATTSAVKPSASAMKAASSVKAATVPSDRGDSERERQAGCRNCHCSHFISPSIDEWQRPFLKTVPATHCRTVAATRASEYSI